MSTTRHVANKIMIKNVERMRQEKTNINPYLFSNVFDFKSYGFVLNGMLSVKNKFYCLWFQTNCTQILTYVHIRTFQNEI